MEAPTTNVPTTEVTAADVSAANVSSATVAATTAPTTSREGARHPNPEEQGPDCEDHHRSTERTTSRSVAVED